MAVGGIALKNWKFITAIIVPLIFLPMIFLGETEIDAKRFRCAYTILVMGFFWMFEVLPLAVTAFIPIVFFSVLGVQPTSDVVGNYMRETQMMFISGITLALSLQFTGLHKRIALKIMILIGTSPWRLLLGILVTTTLLSCVIIVNTAVAAMMTPIVAGLLEGLDDTLDPRRERKLKVVFLLAVGYGANIGGTATIIGSQPAIIYKDLIEKENLGQDGKYVDLNFFTYSAFSIPTAAINLFVMWLVLGFFHLGFENGNNSSSTQGKVLEEESAAHFESFSSQAEVIDRKLRKKYEDLGPMGFHEGAVLALLSLAVTLWFTKDPRIFPGWISLFPKMKIGDSAVGVAVSILLFMIPRKLEFFKRKYEGSGETLLTWQYVQAHFPWGVIFIVGGGMAISDGTDASGLSEWLGEQLSHLDSLPLPVILLVLLLTISVFTEFMSNTATVSLLTPILIDLSKQMNVHPLYLSLPGSIACQYAFVLPTSNPSNAIVYSVGEMRITDMAKTGVILNFACILVLYFMNQTWGEYVVFNYRNYEYPNPGVTYQNLNF